MQYNKTDNRFVMTSRCQTVEIAAPLRGQLTKPAGARFTMTNYDCVPAHPFVEDPALALRVGEQFRNAADLLAPVK
jgi:hypothetical protein